MGTIILVILKFAASALWVAGFYTLAKDIDAAVVSGGSGGPSGMLDVFMQLGLFGIFQSIGALRGLYAWWGGSMETQLNTRHFTLWKNSSGDVVAAEEDHAAPLWGCFIMLVVGGFLVVACSALVSPIMFIVNVSSALILLTSWNKDRPSVLGYLLSVIVCVVCIGGTIYGWNYISTRMDILQERRKAEVAERQRQYEEKQAEQKRIEAERRAEEERQKAARRAEQEQLRIQKKAEKEMRAAERKAESAARRAEQEQKRAQKKAERATRAAERKMEMQAKKAEKQAERATRNAARQFHNPLPRKTRQRRR